MIGYYAHSHGSGHCNYAQMFSRVFGDTMTVFTDRKYSFEDNVHVVRLPNEDTDGTEFDRAAFPEPRALHYAPLNLRKITERNCSLLDEIIRKDIKLLIVDVSVEIAMLARTSSVPYAYVRLHGNRSDIPHLNAYEGASFLLAYFPEEMEDRDTPKWIRKKTVYLGFLSRYMFGSEISQRPIEFKRQGKPILLHISGFGGSLPLDFSGLSSRYDIYSVGPGRIRSQHSQIVSIGVVKSTKPFIEHADVILAACGSNTISEILSLGKTFVAVPENRPYEEHEVAAKNLNRLAWATKLTDYPRIYEAVDAARKLTPSHLPTVEPKKLLAFFCTLKKLDFRADQFLELSASSENSFQYSKNDTEYSTIFKQFNI